MIAMRKIDLLQRRFGQGAVIAGTLLLFLSFWLPPSPHSEPLPADRPGFLPTRYETVVISVSLGHWTVTLTPAQAFMIVFASAMVLLTAGGLLLWRSRLPRPASKIEKYE